METIFEMFGVALDDLGWFNYDGIKVSNRYFIVTELIFLERVEMSDREIYDR